VGDASNSGGDRKRKKKSRWASSTDGSEKTFIPGMPTILPSNLNPDQQEAYLGNYNFIQFVIHPSFYFTTRSLNQQLHIEQTNSLFTLSFNQ
jgi:hypothetical protein